jgi:hypothetical protein
VEIGPPENDYHDERKMTERQEAELLSRLVSERYEHGSIILTRGRIFTDWGKLLSAAAIAAALQCCCII